MNFVKHSRQLGKTFRMGFASRTVCTLSAVKWSVVAVLCALGAGELLQKQALEICCLILILGLVRQ